MLCGPKNYSEFLCKGYELKTAIRNHFMDDFSTVLYLFSKFSAKKTAEI